MKRKVLAITVILLLLSNLADSAAIYKCTKKDKAVMFTDKSCPADMSAQLIYTETEQEIKRRALEQKIATIKRLITNKQAEVAKEFALKNNLTGVYDKQLALYLKQQAEEQQQNIERDKQQQLAIQQQTLALQKQQLELQKQQIAIEKSQAEQQKQLINNPPYSVYPRFTQPHRNNCQSLGGLAKDCPQMPATKVNSAPFPTGGMNPLPSFNQPMNPPQTFPSKMNPP
jgi:hypothetical protein